MSSLNTIRAGGKKGLLAGVLLVSIGAWASDWFCRARDMSEVAKLTQQMKTVCVGRFLVEVPSRAEVTVSRQRIAGFDIDMVDESEEEFAERMSAREADIARSDVSAVPSGTVHARDLLAPGMRGRTFIYGRERTYGFEHGRRVELEWESVESHAHVEGLTVSLSMKYGSEAKAREAEALLARVRSRKEEEVPSEPGFCVWRAVFAEPLRPYKGEHAAFYMGLPDHPDVVIAFASMPGGGTDPDLLARSTETDYAADFDELLRVKRLRAGKRSINGIGGEEVLERIHELNFATTYAFMWETRGVDGDPLQPFVSLELQGGLSSRPGGKAVDTSLHQDAIVALWDRISSTMRPLRGPSQPRP